MSAAWLKAKAVLARTVQNARRWTNRGFQLHLDLLLPPECLSCQAEMDRPDDGIFLCPACRTALAPEPAPRCARCGTTTLMPVIDCPWCRLHDLQFDMATPLGHYRDRLRDVVLQMKHVRAEPLSRSMGRLMARVHGESLRAWRADLIVPVPMHWRRRMRRPTNSPDVLAQCLSKELGIPVKRALRRTRNTKLQRELGVDERFRNLHGAFGLRAGYALGGTRVLLVDDILTTGATASSAARVLKRAGAAAVAVAVIARAQGAASQ